MTGHEPATDVSDANLGDASTYHEWAGDHYPLEEGKAVYDIRDLVTTTNPHEESGEAIVVDTHPTSETDVYTATFSSNGEETALSEYHLNRLYADFMMSARVVTIAWASLLDGLAPQWRDHRDDPEALMSHLRRLERDWDVSLAAHGRTYSYPESRLIPIDAVPDEALP